MVVYQLHHVYTTYIDRGNEKMTGKSIIAILVTFAVALGLLYLLDITVFGGKSDLMQNVIKLVTVLVVVGIAGFITGKVVKHEGIDVKLAK